MSGSMTRRKLPLPVPTADRKGVRVNLTLSVETVAVLDRMGAVTGAGRASILREMIEESAPQLAQMAAALEHAHSQRPADALKVLGVAVNALAEQSEQLSLDIQRTRRRAMRKAPVKS